MSARAHNCKAQAGVLTALPSSFFTMSNSPLRGLRRAANLVPPAHCLRPSCSVVVLCLHRISAASAGASAGWYPKILGVSCSPGPEMGGRRSAGRRPASVSQSRSVRRDLTFAEGHATSRRSTVALSAQEPLRTRVRPGGSSRPAIAHRGLRPRAFRHGFTRRDRRHSPLRLQDRLRRRPS